jgi:hypothetical protein
MYVGYVGVHITVLRIMIGATGGNPSTMLLYQAAERAVFDAVGLLLSLSSSVGAESVNAEAHPTSTGVPALCKLLEYCTKVLTDATVGASAGAKADTLTTGGSSRSSTPPVHHRNAAQSTTGTPLPLNEANGDRATLHVLFVLKLLKAALTNSAQADQFKVLLVRYRPLTLHIPSESVINLR